LKKNSIRQKELKLLSKTAQKLPEQEEAATQQQAEPGEEEAAATPITVTTTTEAALIVEELVNEHESFVAYDCPRIYFGIHTNYKNCFCTT
jgi:hypothetical protein